VNDASPLIVEDLLTAKVIIFTARYLEFAAPTKCSTRIKAERRWGRRRKDAAPCLIQVAMVADHEVEIRDLLARAPVLARAGSPPYFKQPDTDLLDELVGELHAISDAEHARVTGAPAVNPSQQYSPQSSHTRSSRSHARSTSTSVSTCVPTFVPCSTCCTSRTLGPNLPLRRV
jgi:hypothetical protein